jgi:hypothetical protein
MDAPAFQRGQENAQFAVAHQRVAPNYGQVERSEFINQREHTFYQSIALEILQLAKCLSAPQMLFLIGVASRTTQRTLARDFDGQKRLPAPQDLSPSVYYILTIHRFLKYFPPLPRFLNREKWLGIPQLSGRDTELLAEKCASHGQQPYDGCLQWTEPLDGSPGSVFCDRSHARRHESTDYEGAVCAGIT